MPVVVLVYLVTCTVSVYSSLLVVLESAESRELSACRWQPYQSAAVTAWCWRVGARRHTATRFSTLWSRRHSIRSLLPRPWLWWVFSWLSSPSSSSIMSSDSHHFVCSATVMQYLCVFMPQVVSPSKGSIKSAHMGSLTCAMILVCAVHMKARWALMSLHKCLKNWKTVLLCISIGNGTHGS